MNFIDYQKNSALELTGPRNHGNTDSVYKITRKHLPLLFNALYSTVDILPALSRRINGLEKV